MDLLCFYFVLFVLLEVLFRIFEIRDRVFFFGGLCGLDYDIRFVFLVLWYFVLLFVFYLFVIIVEVVIYLIELGYLEVRIIIRVFLEGWY